MAEDLRDVTVASVHKGDVHAAELRRVGSQVEFRLRDDYDGPPVATNLHDDVIGLPAGAVPPFFAGLLPEGRRLSALRAAVATSADDELTLLLAVGGDTVGDVRVARAGQQPTSPAPRFSPGDAGDVRFADLLAASVGTDPERVALPGVQDKVSARTAHAPVRTGMLSDAILKFETSDFPRQVDNEAACLDAARVAGLATADHELVHDGAGWMPSPIYDVMFTHPYGDTDTLALPLHGQRNVVRIDRAHLLAAAAETGVPSAALQRGLDRLLARTADVPEQLSQLGFPGANPNKLRRVLEQRRTRLAG